MNEISDL
jgi:hypothetical protein